MVQMVEQNRPETTPNDGAPTLWGLRAGELHEAFWHARGVQCVRRGQRQTLQRTAELYLLVEPEQLVVFPLAELTSRLTWHNAVVTRIRLVDESAERYSEQVMLDEHGRVERISRRYRPRHQGSYRVILTTSRRSATIWMNASSRREGWVKIRRSVPWARVDHWRCNGQAYTAGSAKAERALIDALVTRWPNPGQSIAGVEELEPGVWGPLDQPLSGEGVRIGPLWVGLCDVPRNGPVPHCLVGPTWTADTIDTTSRPENAPAGGDAWQKPIHVKEIADVEEDPVKPGPRVTQIARRPFYYFAKRGLDVLVSGSLLIMLAPLLLMIALMVLLEDGRPVLFGHSRQGKGGKVFKCWKFRTMVPNAEQLARDLDEYNQCDGPQVYIQDDPRVTKVGKLLRPAHLDELPQLWNVLVGQMSLVGPRPSPDDENQFCPAWRDIRLSVRPGITGVWQLNRTREPGEDFQEWIRYDIRYVRNAGFLFDLKLLAKTAWVVVFGRG